MLWSVVQNAVVAGILAVIVAFGTRLRRSSPATKHAMWLLVMLKLVTPPFGSYPIPDWLARSASAAERAFMLSVRPAASSERPDSERLSIEAAGAASLGNMESFEPGDSYSATHLDVSTALPNDASKFSGLGSWLLLIWASGACPLATIQVIRIIRMARVLRMVRPAPAWLVELVRLSARRLGVRSPQVRMLSLKTSPMLCSLGRTQLLWPENVDLHLPSGAVEAVLLHELAHLKRRDHWVAWLELLAGVFWWFHPVYWYARHQLRENAELACDAWVVALLPDGRRAYAEALIEVTDFASVPAAYPAVGMGSTGRTFLERRLRMILREHIPCRVPMLCIAILGLAFVLVAPGWTSGQSAKVQDAFAQQDTATVAPGTIASETSAIERTDKASEDRARAAQLLLEATRPRSAAVPAPGTVQASSATAHTAQVHTAQSPRAQALPGTSERGAPRLGALNSSAQFQATVANDFSNFIDPTDAPEEVETLTRVRYQLPSKIAETAVSLIREHFSEEIIATALPNDVLTVIASPAEQRRIAGFVELLKGGRPAKQVRGDAIDSNRSRPRSGEPQSGEPQSGSVRK